MSVCIENYFNLGKIKPVTMETDIKSLPDFKIAEMLLSRLELAEISGNFAELIKEAARRLKSQNTSFDTPHPKFFKWIRDRLVYQYKINEFSVEITEFDRRIKLIFGENGNELNLGYSNNEEFFTRVYDYLIELGENPNYDYMTSFKERIENLFRKRP